MSLRYFVLITRGALAIGLLATSSTDVVRYPVLAGSRAPATRRLAEPLSRAVSAANAAHLVPGCFSGAHTTMGPPCDSVAVSGLTNSSGSVTFRISNSSGSIESYNLSCAYTAPVTSCSGSSTVDVSANSTSNTVVSLTIGVDSGTGTISLTATSSVTGDQAKDRVKIHSAYPSLGVSTDFTNNDNQQVALCANACFAVTQAVATPPYFSLGTPRSVSLVYHGDRMAVRPFVFADVTPATGTNAPDTLTLQVKNELGNLVTFTNGETQLRFTNPALGTVRLGGQFDASSYTTGAYAFKVVTTAHYPNVGSVTHYTETDTIPMKLLVENERNSPTAKGWMVGGLQRLYVQSDSTLVLTQGDGSVMYFAKSGASYTSPRGDYSSWAVSGSGTSGTWTRAFPDSTKIRFNGSGQMLWMADRVGDTVRYDYDVSSRLTCVHDPILSDGSGGTACIRLYYNATYGIDSIVSPGKPGSISRKVVITRGADSTLQTATDPDGLSTNFRYDASKRLSTAINRRGDTTSYVYDATSWKLSRVIFPRVPFDAGGGNTTTDTSSVSYRAWQIVGVPTSATSSPPAVPIIPDSMTARVTDPRGHIGSYSVDRWGQPLRSVDPAGLVTTVYRSVAIRPDADSVRTAEGGISRFWYSGAFLTQKWLTNGDTTHYDHGAYGQLTKIWGPGRPTEDDSIGPNGNTTWTRINVDSVKTRYTYDSQGRVLSVTDPKNHTTYSHYESAFGNLDSTLAPGNRFSKVTLDAYGRDSSTIASGIARRVHIYDVINRPVKAIAGKDTTLFSYDALYRTRIQDARRDSLQVYRFDHDALGRTTREYDPADTLNRYISYRYNKDGLLASRTNRRAQQLDLSYTALHQLSSKTGTAASADSFAYSTDGKTSTQWNAIGRDSVFQSSSGWIDSVVTRLVVGAGTKRFRTYYHADTRFRLDSMSILSDAGITFPTRRYFYSSTLGTLDKIKIGSDSVTFGYNADFLRTQSTWASGRSRAESYTTEHQRYDANVTNSSGGTIIERGIGYDTSARVVEYIQKVALHYDGDQLGYDSLGHLASRQPFTNMPGLCSPNADYGYRCTGTLGTLTSYKYDGAGNDTTANAAAYGKGNRLLSWVGGLSFVLDLDGSRTVKRKSSSDSTVYY